MIENEHDNRLMHPHEVAALLEVNVRTLLRWGKQGTLHPVLTVGGHRRYSRREVLGLQARMDHGWRPERRAR